MDDRKRKWVYWSTVVGSTVLLTGLYRFILAALGQLVHGKAAHGSSHWPLFVVYAFIGSITIARGILRRFGQSLDGDTTEILTRRAGAPAVSIPQRIEVGARHRWALGCAGLISGLMGLVILTAGGFCVVVGLLAGVLALICLLGCFTDSGLTCVAGPNGITRCSVFPFLSRRVRWEQIEGCMIRTRQDALGRPTSTTCTLYDRAGRDILCVEMTAVSARERDQLLSAIRLTQGSSEPAELVAAEVPAGLGTEPEAAEAPAGRGTEPEAAAVAEAPAQAASLRGRERAS